MSTSRRIGMRVPILVSALCSAWLVSTETLNRWVIDVVSEMAYLWFVLLALPAFAVALVWSLIHLLRARSTHRRAAATPLVINVLALLLFLAPLGPIVDRIDFHVHYAVRMEVVQRLEAGELWNGSPLHSFVPLPSPGYQRSVSNGAGQRGITVYRDEGALHVVFHPVQGLLSEWAGFLYRSDGLAPSLPNRYLPDAVRSEPLGDRWHRVIFKNSLREAIVSWLSGSTR